MPIIDRLTLYVIAAALVSFVCLVTYILVPDIQTTTYGERYSTYPCKGEPMPNMNRIMLIGHLGQDPETRYTKSGKAVTTFSLATNFNKKRPDGGWDSFPEWHKIICWEKQSERAATFHRGDAVFVDGRLTYNKWEDKEGKKYNTPEIVASLVWKFEEAPPNRREERGYTPPPADDDDVPF